MNTASVAGQALDAGLRRVLVLAWRDIDHGDAGGSELYVDRITTSLAQMGFEVTLRTGRVPGRPGELRRDGVRVIRRGSGATVVPRAAMAGVARRLPAHDAVIEVWNGVPYLTPVWARTPRVAVLHHLHSHLWSSVLPTPLAQMARYCERALAPRVYRYTAIATLAASTRADLVARTVLHGSSIRVVSPGVDPSFCVDPEAGAVSESSDPERPMVIVVARLVPSKRVDAALGVIEQVRREVPNLEAVIVGVGPEEARLRGLAGPSVHFVGNVDPDELVRLYRSAAVLLAPSKSEGWGMTITEAAACGTPAVAADTPGHVDAVQSGETGLLVDGEAEMTEAVLQVLTNADLRNRMAENGIARAIEMRWDTTASALLELLVNQLDK